ncbi:TPA: hypothetical protein ACP32N_005024 [Pseudomonas aeruginosa]
MSTQPSPLEQLKTLGYSLLTGSMRFTVAMSMGHSVYAQDQVGSVVKISCKEGVLTVSPAQQTHAMVAPAFQVQRNL